MLSCQFRLRMSCLGQAQIIKSEFRRHTRLRMAGKERRGFRDVCPLGETFPPPTIVLGNGMKLGQIESHEPDAVSTVRQRGSEAHVLFGARAANAVKSLQK